MSKILEGLENGLTPEEIKAIKDRVAKTNQYAREKGLPQINPNSELSREQHQKFIALDKEGKRLAQDILTKAEVAKKKGDMLRFSELMIEYYEKIANWHMENNRPRAANHNREKAQEFNDRYIELANKLSDVNRIKPKFEIESSIMKGLNRE